MTFGHTAFKVMPSSGEVLAIATDEADDGTRGISSGRTLARNTHCLAAVYMGNVGQV